jgi:Mg2+ and Co2+ transporter CorA
MQKETELENSYISNKITELVEKVGDQYGELLLDELFRRLDNTINDFEDEVKELFESLKKDEDKKQSVIDLMRKGKNVLSEQKGDLISDWEIKLAEMEEGENT